MPRNSKSTAENSDIANRNIRDAVGGIAAETKKLLSIVDSVDSKIQNLAASTQEISASTTIISDTLLTVKEELNSLV